jgi:hypothetical protein
MVANRCKNPMLQMIALGTGRCHLLTFVPAGVGWRKIAQSLGAMLDQVGDVAASSLENQGTRYRPKRSEDHQSLFVEGLRLQKHDELYFRTVPRVICTGLQGTATLVTRWQT